MSADIEVNSQPQICVAPLPHPQTSFNDLPDYILNHIYSYFTPKTLVKTTQVCKSFQQHNLKDPVHQALRKKALARQREYFVHRTIELSRTRVRERNLQRAQKLKYILGREQEVVLLLSVFLFTLFVTLKVTQAISWSWEIVFVPLIPVFYVMFSTSITVDVASTKSALKGASFAYDQPLYFGKIFFGENCFGNVSDNNIRTQPYLWRIGIYSPILGLLIFFILLLLNLTGRYGVRPWLVMLPLLILSVITAATGSIYYNKKLAFLCKIAAVVVFIFLLLVTLKLEHAYTRSWALVFIPIFIVTVLAILVIRCASSKCAIVCCYCCMLVPMLVFEAMMVGYLEHSLSFAAVAVPMLIVEVLGVIVCYL